MTKGKNNNNTNIIVAIVAGIVTFVIALVLVLNRNSGGNEQVVTYEKVSDGITMSLTYYAKDGLVYKQTAKNTIPYSVLGATTKEEAGAILDPAMEEVLKDALEIDGYEDTVEYHDDKAIENVSIDFNVVDKDKLKDIVGAYFEGDTEQGWSLEKSTKWLEDSGFTKVEE
ncbi:DUF1307 domain-containing protein [Candidatus Saccharibacteria bacterium]|nr:DUF1307 domain-containing protein [Candidatus Saccharibacteria bacterium]